MKETIESSSETRRFQPSSRWFGERMRSRQEGRWNTLNHPRQSTPTGQDGERIDRTVVLCVLCATGARVLRDKACIASEQRTQRWKDCRRARELVSATFSRESHDRQV